MKLSQDTLMDIMAYADGELAGEDADRVERLLATSEEARRAAEAFGWSPQRDGHASVTPLGAWLAHTLEERAVAAGADGTADAVLAKIAEERKPVALDVARRRRAARERVAWGAAALVAMAAGVLFYVRSKDEPQTAKLTPEVPAETTSAVPPPPAESSLASNEGVLDEEQGVEVDTIESPSHEVSVFYVPGMGENLKASSVVIWIDESTDGQ